MKLRKLVGTVIGGQDAIIKSLGWVARGLLFIMMLLVTGNVVARFLFNKPLLGTVELVELMMVVIAFFAMPYTTMKRGHVRVEVVISRFSRRTRAILASIMFFVSAGIFAVITYQASVDAIFLAYHPEKMTSVLFIPFAPFRFVMVLGCLLLCLRRLVDVFHPLAPEE